MASYPMDPNYLFKALLEVNAKIQALTAEGWTVTLKVTPTGQRVWCTVETTRACDPPEPADQ